MVYDENTPYLGDEVDGDTVTIVSNVGGRKDRNFARNWAQAKYLADRGTVKTVLVNVVANGETYRTVSAFARAVGTPHPAARALVTHVSSVADAMAVVDGIAAIMPLAGDAPAEVAAPAEKAAEKAPDAAPAAPAPAVAPAEKVSEKAAQPAKVNAATSQPSAAEFDAKKAENVAAVTS